MLRGDEQLTRAKPDQDGLASYRRLIELQKQMIELSQHHERSRRECAALRDTVAREVLEQTRARQSASGRLREIANRLMKRVPLRFARQLFS